MLKPDTGGMLQEKGDAGSSTIRKFWVIFHCAAAIQMNNFVLMISFGKERF
jgi:hypothetical protein